MTDFRNDFMAGLLHGILTATPPGLRRVPTTDTEERMLALADEIADIARTAKARPAPIVLREGEHLGDPAFGVDIVVTPDGSRMLMTGEYTPVEELRLNAILIEAIELLERRGTEGDLSLVRSLQTLLPGWRARRRLVQGEDQP